MIIIGCHGISRVQLISYIFKPEGIQIALKYNKFNKESNATEGKLLELCLRNRGTFLCKAITFNNYCYHIFKKNFNHNI